MSKHRKISLTLGYIALVMALLSFILGSAPFTPVFVLGFLSIPLAIVSGYLGSWRLAVITVYFSVASLSVIPLSRELSFRIDYLLVLMVAAGVIIGGVLFYEYKRVSNVT